MTPHIAFIGGGNMASAIVGGLLRSGTPAQRITVLEPFEATRAALAPLGLRVLSAPDDTLSQADIVVWAVKPQIFKEAAAQCQAVVRGALHLSVAAGIPSDSIARWLNTERVVRAMPNTPALIGKGMTALFARASVKAQERQSIEGILAATGALLWVEAEAQLDAVTALSGSGPAYVFYFLEAMTEAGSQLGLSPAQAYQLALGTFAGATALAQDSPDTPELLRQKVTSKGGTTHAAISAMDASGLKPQFVAAMRAAHARAEAMGVEFGTD